ncbi:hypothetical protein CQ046_09230 [Chryseobacterium sp. MYb7]|jgi:hypothetical protein|uniref:hypothetical protein n=1 Tax=Chryseobacterium sp. MYb7 TaxID=1827290 RepID=UPI000CFFFEDA|nr:hypothetical protein [Chryseobacterium sp. MYb7]PRB03547.1 hypothetical protein CQ046_09230 [Chryseobacterium sp. MYb7]
MATYESVIKITGAVGDLVFYNLNGKNVVRKKSGFNKTAFKKSPSYEKVRQNSSEFGHCSKIGKVIRKSLEIYIKESGDPLLYQKFAKVMTAIKDLDTISERGKRTVELGLKTEEGRKLLREFQMGAINKVSDCIRIQDQVLYKNDECTSDQAVVITIKLDSENYKTESAEEIITWDKKQESSFKKYFSEDGLLLYFVVLKNEKNEITHMGFV